MSPKDMSPVRPSGTRGCFTPEIRSIILIEGTKDSPGPGVTTELVTVASAAGAATVVAAIVVLRKHLWLFQVILLSAGVFFFH